jgi:hypothetical protein
MKNETIIATPIDDRKLYCWNEFVESIMKIEGADEIVLCDTSKDQVMKDKIMGMGFTYIHIWKEKAMDRVVKARRELADYAIRRKANIMFIDADIIAPPNIIKELSNVKKANVVTGLGIILNGAVPIPSAKIMKEGNYYAFPQEKIDGNTYPVDCIGLGCCWIHLDVLMDIPFRCERDKEGKLIKSEDHCFSLDCLSDGYPLLFHTGVVTQHKISGEGHWDFETS